jgi:hypothetical protein
MVERVKYLPQEKRHTPTCYSSGDWVSIPCKTRLFLITSLAVSQGSSFNVDICNIPGNADCSNYSLPEVGSGFLHRLKETEQRFALFGSSLYILTRDEEKRSTARNAVV